MIREIVVKAPNRVGLLANIAALLAEKGINIIAVYGSARDGEAEIHLITDAQTYARDTLRDAEYEVEMEEVILLELPHRPGFLRRVAEALRRHGVDILRLYATAPEWSEKSLVVMACDNNGRALDLLGGERR